jgi:hypothetical protein
MVLLTLNYLKTGNNVNTIKKINYLPPRYKNMFEKFKYYTIITSILSFIITLKMLYNPENIIRKMFSPLNTIFFTILSVILIYLTILQFKNANNFAKLRQKKLIGMKDAKAKNYLYNDDTTPKSTRPKSTSTSISTSTSTSTPTPTPTPTTTEPLKTTEPPIPTPTRSQIETPNPFNMDDSTASTMNSQWNAINQVASVNPYKQPSLRFNSNSDMNRGVSGMRSQLRNADNIQNQYYNSELKQ